MSEPVVEQKESGSPPADGPPEEMLFTKESPDVDAVPEKENQRKIKDFREEKDKPTHANVDMSQIELKAEDLYDKEKIDLETIEIEDVFKLLQCEESGLTNEEATLRLEIFGPNRLANEEQNAFLQFLSFMWNPLSWVMEAAALVAIALSNGERRPPDWQNFIGIILLLLINSSIGFYEERNASNAVKSLVDSLAPKAKVKRDGKLVEIESAELVPGDTIFFKIGDIVPADCRLSEATDVSIDQRALTGESLPSSKKLGDQCFSGSTCKQGEANGVVISTGSNSFFGRAASLVSKDDDTTRHLQKILAQIGSFCLVVIGIFVILEILILYAAYGYSYRNGLNNILVLLIGGTPIAMPTVLSVTLAVGAQQLAKYNAIVTQITAIEGLSAVTILCSGKTGILTTNELTIDRSFIRTYGSFSLEDVILLAAYASRIENQDAIDSCVVKSIGDTSRARSGITLLDFKPFNPVDKRTEITYRDESSGKLKRVTKGMAGIIIELCTRNKTDEIENKLETDVEEFAMRGLRSLAVAYEEVDQVDGKDDHEAEGTGFELVGLLPILDPFREDTKQAIDDAIALGVRVKMVTGDQLAIAKETGRRLVFGDDIYPAKVLKDKPAPGCKHASLNGMITDADGFADVFPEHKYEIVKRLQGLGHLCAMTGDGANDAPALSRATVGIAVEGATDAARAAADIVLTEPGLSTIVRAIRGSRVIFQRMKNYSIYACAVTVRIVVCFAILAFAYNFNFPPFMVLIIALFNDGTIMTSAFDCVLPSKTPDSWNLTEIFAYAVAYGLYLSLSTIVLVVIVLESNFFQRTFHVTLTGGVGETVDPNDPMLHTIVYLQVAIISQALIFVTRSHGFFFMERPSTALVGAFCIAQLISSLIAAYGNWGFTNIRAISGGWIGIVWIWNLIWFLPLDLIKFAMKATVIKYLHKRQERVSAEHPTRTVPHGASIHESLYSNRVSFIRRAAYKVGFGGRVSMDSNELQRFSYIQTQHSSAVLAQSQSP